MRPIMSQSIDQCSNQSGLHKFIPELIFHNQVVIMSWFIGIRPPSPSPQRNLDSWKYWISIPGQVGYSRYFRNHTCRSRLKIRKESIQRFRSATLLNNVAFKSPISKYHLIMLSIIKNCGYLFTVCRSKMPMLEIVLTILFFVYLFLLSPKWPTYVSQ